MSTIITELTCEHCGEKWQGYMSFGHPENTFEYKWTCDKCGVENSQIVKEWIDSKGPQNEVVIYQGDNMAFQSIFTFDLNEGVQAIPFSEFEWSKPEDEQMGEIFCGQLTLEDITAN